VNCWNPPLGISWDYQLGGANLNRDVELFFIDNDAESSVFSTLKSKGKHIICYISAGAAENWRADYSSFPSSLLGNPLDGWPGEYYVDIRKTSILEPIFRARIENSVSKGCEGIDWDNVDVFEANSGFPLTQTDGINFLTFLSTLTRSYGLSVGLKNCPAVASSVVQLFDFSVSEQCAQYKGQCNLLMPFVNSGKPVFDVEYVPQGSCSGIPSQFEGIVRDLSLSSNGVFTQCKTYSNIPAPEPAPQPATYSKTNNIVASVPPVPVPAPAKKATKKPASTPAPTPAPTTSTRISKKKTPAPKPTKKAKQPKVTTPPPSDDE